jgi:hypothetical protein
MKEEKTNRSATIKALDWSESDPFRKSASAPDSPADGCGLQYPLTDRFGFDILPI